MIISILGSIFKSQLHDKNEGKSNTIQHHLLCP